MNRAFIWWQVRTLTRAIYYLQLATQQVMIVRNHKLEWLVHGDKINS